MHTLIPAPSPAVAGHRPLLLAVAVAACFSVPVALRAQPTGAQAIHGAAALSQQGNKLVVTTTNGAGTNHSAINWQSFSVPAGSATQFNQPSVASTSINRVLGNNPSAIFGTLSSNGRLVLVNPAGIAVGAGAVVDTAGFTASTLRMTDADALAGRLRFGDGSAAGNLSVGGQILARSGDVVLIAPNVETASSALIQSPNGATAIAAGQKVEITGRGLEGIRLELQAPANSAVNLGVLTGDAVGMFAGTLKHSGLISATAATVEGGKVVLKARGDTLVDGRVAATAGPKGGAIDVLGDRVGVYGSAVLDVSGAAGGGVVRVGGDYQGANAAVPNANVTFVGSGASIRADGGTTGDGGRVIVWADDMTRMAGQISARGGSQAGDGGFVEVSGKKGLELTGRADLRAPFGNAGTLLLDPNDITISGPHTSNPAPSPPPPTAAPNYDFSPSDETATIAVATIEDQLALGHVRVMSNVASNGPGGGLITVQNPISWTSSYALALEADSSIAVNANISGPAGALALIAKGAGTITQAPAAGIQVSELILATETGAATLESSTNNVGSLAASVASLSFKNSNSLTIKELTNPFVVGTVIGVTADGHASIKTLAGNITVDAPIAAGSVALDAAGSIVATAGISTWGGDAGNPATGAVKLDAGGGITFTTINTNGSGSYSIDGGPVTLTAVGNIVGESINASGYTGYYDDRAAQGGNVSVTSSNGGITLAGSVLAIGSDSLSWEGGAGGNVTLDAKNNVSVGDIATHGGSSGDYYDDGDIGGNGGYITVTSSLGSVNAGSLGSFGGSSQIYSAGHGGVVTLSGKLGVTVLGVDSYGGAVMDGDYDTAHGGNGGEVTITSSDGAVSVGNVQTFGGDSPSFGGGTGGAVTLSGKLGVTAFNIATYGGANTVGEEYEANGGDGGNVTITASSGAISTGNIRTSGGNSVSMGGGNGGAVVVSANGNVSVGNVFTHGGSNLYDNYQGADGGDGGDVSITSTLGSISGSVGVGGGSISSYGGNSHSRDGGHGGSVRMSAEGSILLNAIRTIGGDNASHGSGSGGFGGDVSLSSNSGGISLLAGGGGIRTWGGYGHNALPGDGGAVELFAKATSGPGIAGAIYTPEIDTGGGDAGSYYASGGSAGGSGGSILVEAGTLFAVPLIHAQGGNGGTSTIGAAGGNSGDVNIRQLTGSLNLSGMAIYAHGGSGGYGLTVGGAGGAGGDVRLRGDGGIVSNATTMINATGGQGGDSEGTSAADRGGAGGHGGGISLSAPGAAMTLAGSLGAFGGAGGLIYDDSSSTGGNGGAGGTISISGGTMSLADVLAINVGGGLAGHAQEEYLRGTSFFLPMDAYVPPLSSYGAAGSSGRLTTSLTGGMSISYASPAPAVTVIGDWDNTGAITLATGSSVLAKGTFYNQGDVLLRGNWRSAVPDGTYFITATDDGTFYNNAGGTLRGSGTVYGNVVNQGGIVSPQGLTTDIGVLQVSGNFTQTSGELRGEVYSTVVADPNPGEHFDQVSVGGTLTISGGSLVVSGVSTPGVAPPPSSGDSAPGDLLLPMWAMAGESFLPMVASSGYNLVSSPSPVQGAGFATINTSAAPAAFTTLVQVGGATPKLAPPPSGGASPPAPSASPAPSPAPTVGPTPAPTAAPTPAPTPGPTAAPTPAPTSAPAPTAAPVTTGPTVDKIVALLRDESSRDAIQQAVTEQENVVTKFVALLLKEEAVQSDEKKKEKAVSGEITVTDTSCKP